MIAFAQNQCGQYAQSTIQFVSLNAFRVQVNPNGPFDNSTVFNRMVDKMEELGLWLIYPISK